MFAIDGVTLPSNASKHRSGTRAEFAAQATKLEAVAQTMLARHRAEDAAPCEPTRVAKEAARVATLERDAAEIRTWLAAHPDDRRGPTGGLRKSNHTDNDSAKMAASNGVLEGYTGVAAVDAAHQIVVAAAAFGTGAEQECLLPMVDATDALRGQETLITADAGYHSEANRRALATNGVDAHRAAPDPLHDKSATTEVPRLFQPTDFQYDATARTCVCPAGKSLYRKGAQLATKGYLADHFQGAQRFAVVEPVFANLKYNKGLDRFTLRGRTNVDGQWKLFCLVQNIEKLALHGYAA